MNTPRRLSAAEKAARKQNKERKIYESAMNNFLSLKKPKLVGKSGECYPSLKGTEVFVPLHREEQHLEFYFDFFSEIVDRFNIDIESDDCSFIFDEADLYE